MKSKKTQLLDLMVMLPKDKKLYSLNSHLINACRMYADFTSFIYEKRRKLGSSKNNLSKHSEYIKLAENKGYINFVRAVPGTLFYLPKGDFVFDVFHKYINNQMRREGFIKLTLPHFFQSDLNKNQKEMNPLEQLVVKFKGRMIAVSFGKNIFHRYASDPMLFEYLRDKTIPTRQDPLKIYSPGFTFRKEKEGELKKLKRPRTSYIEDYHIFTSDALEEIKFTHKLNSRIMNELCDEWFISCDIEKNFFEKHQSHLYKLVDMCQKPIIFNILKAGVNYYTLQFKYSYRISDGTFIIFANLQLDNINGKRFNIQIENKGPARIIHGNTTGRMEKVFIALFDRAIKMKKGSKKPMLPLWISPIQIRIVPVDNSFIGYCISISKQYLDSDFRVDIDDREIEFNKKIQLAEREWIPYIIIVGKKEVESGKITSRVRNEDQRIITQAQSVDELKKRVKNYPKLPQCLPIFVSKQTDLSFL